jgi:hypothetical protein
MNLFFIDVWLLLFNVNRYSSLPPRATWILGLESLQANPLQPQRAVQVSHLYYLGNAAGRSAAAGLSKKSIGHNVNYQEGLLAAK